MVGNPGDDLTCLVLRFIGYPKCENGQTGGSIDLAYSIYGVQRTEFGRCKANGFDPFFSPAPNPDTRGQMRMICAMMLCSWPVRWMWCALSVNGKSVSKKGGELAGKKWFTFFPWPFSSLIGTRLGSSISFQSKRERLDKMCMCGCKISIQSVHIGRENVKNVISKLINQSLLVLSMSVYFLFSILWSIETVRDWGQIGV